MAEAAIESARKVVTDRIVMEEIVRAHSPPPPPVRPGAEQFVSYGDGGGGGGRSGSGVRAPTGGPGARAGGGGEGDSTPLDGETIDSLEVSTIDTLEGAGIGGPGPGPIPPVPSGRSGGGGRSPVASDLELRANDNAFHVVANVVADRFLPKVREGEREFYEIEASDRAFLDQMVPLKVRRSFVEALWYRSQAVPREPLEGESQLETLIRQCSWLGLDRLEKDNFLLNPKIKVVQVGYAPKPIPLTPTPSFEQGYRPPSPRQQQSLSPGAERSPGSLGSGGGGRRRGRRKPSPTRSRSSTGRPPSPSRSRSPSGGRPPSPLRRTGSDLRPSGSGNLRQQRSNSPLRRDRSLSPVAVRRQEEELERRRRTVMEREEELRRQQLDFERRQVEAQKELQRQQMEMQRSQIREQLQSLQQKASDLEVQRALGTNYSNLSGTSSQRRAKAGAFLSGSDADAATRQRILAELKEASALMANSVTPEAANFWKAHILELQARLRKASIEGGDGSRSSAGGYLPPEDANAVIERAKADGSTSGTGRGKVTSHYGAGAGASGPRQTQDSYLASNRRMRGTTGASHDDSVQHLVPDAEVVKSLCGAEEPIKAEPISAEGFPMVDVVAPADLPEGYTFEAQMGNKRFLATVPPGGVVRGEKFTCPMRDLDRVEIEVPTGRWRDDIFNLFAYGFFHPLLLNTICMPHIALGQIMARNRLTWLGLPGSRFQSKSVCLNMFMIVLFWLGMNFLAFFILGVHIQRGHLPSGVDVFCLGVVNITMALYTVYAVTNTRQSIRVQYGIPKQYVQGKEDLLCATFCMPCTIAQMGRHTADFETYRAVCCSNTGLPRSVELAPAPAMGAGVAMAPEESRLV